MQARPRADSIAGWMYHSSTLELGPSVTAVGVTDCTSGSIDYTGLLVFLELRVQPH